jgi:N-acyl-D-amino-acid deacylase
MTELCSLRLFGSLSFQRLLLQVGWYLASAASLAHPTLYAQSTTNNSPTVVDLVLRNGKIVDGSGNPWFHGDVAISGERIALVGTGFVRGRREIDVGGKVIAPGFIDIHSHSDWTLFQDGNAESKIRQGVTTEVLGEGFSGAPYKGEMKAKLVEIAGRQVAIATFDDYFRALEESTISVNVASYAGICNLWQCVMGYSFARPTPENMAAMQALLDEALADGAFGLSAQVMTPPGSLATTQDLIELCAVVREHGGVFTTHIRNEGSLVFDSVDEAIRVAEQAQVPTDVIHLKIADEKYWGNMRGIIEKFDSARRRGVNVQANVYPYTRGNNNLSSIIPPWAHEGGREKLLERLAAPEQRQRLKVDIENGLENWYNHYTAVGKDWSRMLIAEPGAYRGQTMDQVIATKVGQGALGDSLDILFDLLIEHGGGVSTVYAHHEERDMNMALSQPWCSVGSDGSALAISGVLREGNPHPRSFGTFPRVLGVYVREQGLLSLEEAVRKITSMNANKLGVYDRGMLRPGLFADITVFDETTVSDLSTYTEPFQYNRGMELVIVNGQIVIDGEQHTGSRAGKVLRHTSKKTGPR